jgi:DNA-3-methyladenine glycosylase I
MSPPPPDGLAVAPDGRPRCWWAVSATAPEYLTYHDTEWGRPVTGEDAVFERLVLEGFQSGLSWLTILRKREAFRAAFAGFSVERVAAFGDRDVERLLADAAIVRHRGKIEAAIGNARATLALHENGDTLAGLLWGHAPAPRPRPAAAADVPAQTAESRALSRTLKARGFRFVGPTTLYSAMQACGVVDDHLAGCAAHEVRSVR